MDQEVRSIIPAAAIASRYAKEPLPPEFLPEKLGAYSGGIRAATSQLPGAGEGRGGGRGTCVTPNLSLD